MPDDIKKQAHSLLIAGASLSTIKAKIGKGADNALREVFDEISIPSVEEATKISIERLSYLASRLMGKAQDGNEVAINAVVKIMQVQQNMIINYENLTPDEESTLEQFRKKHEERRNKNTTKFKK